MHTISEGIVLIQPWEDPDFIAADSSHGVCEYCSERGAQYGEHLFGCPHFDEDQDYDQVAVLSEN